jgi:hypothetical protein
MLRLPTVTASTSGFSRAPLHTGHGRNDILLDPLPLARAVGVAVAPAERGDDPLERDRVCTPPAHPVAVGDIDLVAVGAVEEYPAPARRSLPLAGRRRSRSARRSPGSRTRRCSSCRRPTGRAPSAIESSGSGTSRSGSISCCAPRPVQRGQAPWGELNERCAAAARAARRRARAGELPE